MGTLFSDELVAFVFRVVVVLEFSGGVDFEIEELMTVGASMSNAG